MRNVTGKTKIFVRFEKCNRWIATPEYGDKRSVDIRGIGRTKFNARANLIQRLANEENYPIFAKQLPHSSRWKAWDPGIPEVIREGVSENDAKRKIAARIFTQHHQIILSDKDAEESGKHRHSIRSIRC